MTAIARAKITTEAPGKSAGTQPLRASSAWYTSSPFGSVKSVSSTARWREDRVGGPLEISLALLQQGMDSTSSIPGGSRMRGRVPRQRQLQRHANSSRCAATCGACIAHTCTCKRKSYIKKFTLTWWHSSLDGSHIGGEKQRRPKDSLAVACKRCQRSSSDVFAAKEN